MDSYAIKNLSKPSPQISPLVFNNRAYVLDAKGESWIHDETNQSTSIVKSNQFISSKDRFSIPEGSSIKVIFDDQEENALYIEGPSYIRIESGKEINVYLDSGTLHAMLDNLDTTLFNVVTTSGTVQVRGTQFRVLADNIGTHVWAYEGLVDVMSKSTGFYAGVIRTRSILPGQKIMIDKKTYQLSDLEIMSKTEFDANENVKRKFEKFRPAVNYYRTIRELKDSVEFEFVRAGKDMNIKEIPNAQGPKEIKNKLEHVSEYTHSSDYRKKTQSKIVKMSAVNNPSTIAEITSKGEMVL